MNIEKINIEVAYAQPDRQRIIALSVPDGTTVGEAIQLSGIQDIFPEIDLTQQKTGIFSRPAALTDAVKDGDRVEIYRPLVMSPMEARRQRAAASPRNRK